MNRTSANDFYAPPLSQLFGTGVELYTRSLGRSLQLQKEILDTVAVQSAASAEVWRSVLRNVPGATAWLNFLQQGMRNATTAERQLVGALADQTTEIAQTAESEGRRAMAAVQNVAHTPRAEKRRRSKAHSRNRQNRKARFKKH
jgi:hypothetical protein